MKFATQISPLLNLYFDKKFCPKIFVIIFFRVEFVQMAIDYKPLNLGQGLPDDLVPGFVIESLKEIAQTSTTPLHQYTRGFVSTVGF